MRTRWVIAIAAVALAAGAGLAAVLLGGGQDPPAPSPARAPRPIGAGDITPHLQALERAARDGTRAAGTAGDAATRTYVGDALRAAGWRVTVQPVRFPYFDERRPPRVTAGRAALVPGRDVRTLAYSGAGRASGAVRAAGSGCRAADFRALRDGEVALVRRGRCLLRAKARNAQAAGAAAVLVVNDGAAVAGTLGTPGVRIPAVLVSAGAGRRLRDAGRATVVVDAVSEERSTANVVAETGTGGRVAMAGAHLDSVAGGPGINDDGSGVAALLAVAGRLGGRAPDGVTLRLGLWGAEELGLYGSRHYVGALTDAQRDAIAAYVNLDMVGTRGGRMAVYRGDAEIRRSLRDALRARGHDRIADEPLRPDSDHAPFDRAGIPVGGVFTGLDRCYHRSCDDAANVDPESAADVAAATAATLEAITSRARRAGAASRPGGAGRGSS